MPTDLMHTDAIIDAAIACLKGADTVAHTNGLPANWFADARDADEVPLRRLEFGDFADYPAESLADLTPAILIRPLDAQPVAPGGDHAYIVEERLRVVHLRQFDECRTSAGAVQTNQTRARIRYTRAILKALFSDHPWQQLATKTSGGTRTVASLGDSNATLLDCRWVGTDYGLQGSEDVAYIRGLGTAAQMWATAIDIAIRVEAHG